MPKASPVARNSKRGKLRAKTAYGIVTGGGWDAGLDRFAQKLEAFDVALLPEVGELMYESIVHGSALTGAPGQPVESGDLKMSWQISYPTETSVMVGSANEYALQNEVGVKHGGGPYRQRSARGGRFSVRMTAAAMQRIVDTAARIVAASVGRAAA